MAAQTILARMTTGKILPMHELAIPNQPSTLSAEMTSSLPAGLTPPKISSGLNPRDSPTS
jgi:hypothetical protein